jgi:tetratricopeptide (TPR) repeat protein
VESILALLLVLLLAALACPATAGEGLPDFDAWWDFGKPDETERRFRELLPRAREAGDACYVAELLTQIARTRGLQQDFDGAHVLLDEADALMGEGCPVARVRSALERGRAFNSAKRTAEARVRFVEAYALATKAGADGYVVDAVHMLAIASEPDEALRWNELAIVLAERSADPKARRWLGSLYNNTGWTWHDKGDYAKALAFFEKNLALRVEQGKPEPVRVARWTVARAMRSLGRLDDALALQRGLLAEHEAAGAEEEGYVREEIGECLWALGHEDEARPFLAEAFRRLSKNAWLSRDEPARLASLKERGRVP